MDSDNIMTIGHFQRTILVWIAFFALFFSLPGTRGNELLELLQEAEANSPVLNAARARIEQALQQHEELLEFFDTQLYAGAGKGENSRNIPLSGEYTVLSAESYAIEAGLARAIAPGAYFNIGARSELLDNVGGYKELYQNTLGLRVRIPLLQDRGFSILGYRRSAALAEYNRAVSDLLALSQELRYQVEQAYITAYEALSAYNVTQGASQRFAALVKDAHELTRLKAIPDYQVHSAERELQIGLEDEEKARNRYDLSLVTLGNLLGSSREIKLRATPEIIVEMGSKQADLSIVPLEKAMQYRGLVLSIQHRQQAARAEYDRIEEEMKDNVSLNVGVSARGENRHTPFEMHRKLSDEYLGGEISLTWTRPLDYQGSKTRLARLTALISELKAELQQAQLTVSREMKNAELNFLSARRRIEIIGKGMQAARETVASEQERFRLGEGSSVDVLDAQKNLTVILQRLTVASADLLRARSQYQYACGFCE
jgi:outer membrane protein TolC